MRNTDRIDKILDELKSLWNRHPDMRLGQLLENYVFTDGKRGDKTSVRMFYQEDDETLRKLSIQSSFNKVNIKKISHEALKNPPSFNEKDEDTYV